MWQRQREQRLLTRARSPKELLSLCEILTLKQPCDRPTDWPSHQDNLLRSQIKNQLLTENVQKMDNEDEQQTVGVRSRKEKEREDRQNTFWKRKWRGF